MKKYRVYIIFALIILLLVLFRQPIGNMINYKSGTIIGFTNLAPGGIDRIRCVTAEGSRALDGDEYQELVNMLKTQMVHTPIFDKEIIFPDEEYLIYSKSSSAGPILRLRMTDDAVEVVDYVTLNAALDPSSAINIFLIDN